MVVSQNKDGMETAKQETLESFRASMLADVPDADGTVGKLERAGLVLTRAEPTLTGNSQASRRTWLLFWEAPPALRESFDLAPELLLVLTPWKEAQAKDVSAAEEMLRRDHRLDRGVVLVVARDRSAERRLGQVVRQTGRLYIFLSFDDVDDVQDPQRWLRDLFQERIGAGDLFAAGRPVFGWDFVGRDREIRSIRGRLLDGRPVGLYIIRKRSRTGLWSAQEYARCPGGQAGNREGAGVPARAASQAAVT
jgi:hypothetical protein